MLDPLNFKPRSRLCDRDALSVIARILKTEGLFDNDHLSQERDKALDELQEVTDRALTVQNTNAILLMSFQHREHDRKMTELVGQEYRLMMEQLTPITTLEQEAPLILKAAKVLRPGYRQKLVLVKREVLKTIRRLIMAILDSVEFVEMLYSSLDYAMTDEPVVAATLSSPLVRVKPETSSP